MKKKKKQLVMSLSVLLISFLLFSSSLNLSDTRAFGEKEHNKYTINSFDSTIWMWNTTEVVSTESTDASSWPSIAVDSAGNIHVAWYDDTDYAGSGIDMDIFYKHWDASTSAWTTTEVVSTESTGGSHTPSLATDSAGNIHIAWNDDTDYAGAGGDEDIFYKRWDASTSAWTTTEVVSTESTDFSYWPSIAVDSAGNIHIAWQDDTDYAGSGTDTDIFYKHWNSSSSSWSATEVVSTESTGGAYAPSLATDSAGNIHIAWDDYTDYAGAGTEEDIFYKRWDASTSAWTTTEVVSTESTDHSGYPSLATDSAGNIHIAWQDYTDYAGAGGDEDIFYKRWDHSSLTWTTTEVVSTESTLYADFSSLVVDSAGNIHVAWNDGANYAGSGIDMDIFYKHWDASTSSWTLTEVVSTESTEPSGSPSLVVDTVGNIHVVWKDLTDYTGAGTDGDIFYKIYAGSPTAPELAFINPNPTEINTINLDWNNISLATSYFVYRSDYYIWSVEDLLSIDEVTTSYYTDTLPSEGYYYYVIVARNFAGNSSHSNCQYVEYKLPHVKEFALISGLILGAFVIALVVLRTRKNKLK